LLFGSYFVCQDLREPSLGLAFDNVLIFKLLRGWEIVVYLIDVSYLLNAFWESVDIFSTKDLLKKSSANLLLRRFTMHLEG
jgi:hypothetical protein